jgi:hypothetical protein
MAKGTGTQRRPAILGADLAVFRFLPSVLRVRLRAIEAVPELRGRRAAPDSNFHSRDGHRMFLPAARSGSRGVAGSRRGAGVVRGSNPAEIRLNEVSILSEGIYTFAANVRPENGQMILTKYP